MADLEMIKPQGVQNLINKFCYTIGIIPTSYKASLTYEEQILAIGHYLETVVYPAINNNAEALTELQGLFVELKNYVDNYFDNLDVQEEINNKLDDMVEQGTLQEIISEYLNSTAIFGFDTVADMISATNLIDGSFARTYGKTTINDTKGSFYKIRKITNDDVVDGENIIAMETDDTLIAEKIYNTYITTCVFGFNTVNEMKNSTELINGSFARTYGKTTINDTKGSFYKIRTKTNDDVVDGENIVAMETSNLIIAEKMQDPYITVFVGDSYGVNMSTHDGWVQKYVDMYGLTLNYDAINVCVGNSGFSDPYGGTNTYLNNLQNATTNIDKTKVKKIIVAGGYNDRTKTATQLEELVETFMTYVKTNFPNAKIYIGMIANDGNVDPTHSTAVNYREWIATQVLQGYKSAEKYGAYYLNGVELVMHNYTLFDSYDYIHPKNEGVIEIARAIHEAENGSYNPISGFYEGVTLRNDTTGFTKDSKVDTINVNIIGQKYNGIFDIKTTGNLSFSNYQLINSTDTSIDIKIGTYTGELPYFRYTNYLSVIPVNIRLAFYSSADIKNVTGQLTFNKDGEVILTVNNDAIGTRYIQTIAFEKAGYSMPILAQ